jgi:hypothetical protein
METLDPGGAVLDGSEDHVKNVNPQTKEYVWMVYED